MSELFENMERPQASLEFQKNLEEQVIAELHKIQSEHAQARQIVLSRNGSIPVVTQRRRSVPLTLAATLAIIVLAGIMLTLIAGQLSHQQATNLGAQTAALQTEEAPLGDGAPLFQVYDMDWAGNGLALATTQGIWLLQADNLDAEPTRLVTSSPATAIAFKPDGTRIASGHANGDIVIWDAQTGDNLFGSQGYEGPINTLLFSPDGLWLAWKGGESNSVKVFRLMSSTLWTTPDYEWPITSFGFSTDSRLLMVNSGPTTDVWDVENGEKAASFNHASNPLLTAENRIMLDDTIRAGTEDCLSASPFMTCSFGTTDGELDCTPADQVFVCPGLTEYVSALVYALDGEHLLASTSEGRIALYKGDPDSRPILTLDVRPQVISLAFSPGGDQLAVLDQSNTLTLYSTEVGAWLDALELNTLLDQ